MSMIGLVLGIGALAAAQGLEGGGLDALLQPAAALVVFGGTFGALLLGTTPGDLSRGLRMLPRALSDPPPREGQLAGRLLALSGVARKLGLMALEQHAKKESDAFLRSALQQLVDGGNNEALREVLENDIALRAERDLAGAEVYEAAGGVAPTLGILGAVLGLIQVMQRLEDPSELGMGIATAFVATLYGVGFANLLLLPIAAKLRRRVDEDRLLRQVVVEGVVAIRDGLSPSALEDRLAPFAGGVRSWHRG